MARRIIDLSTPVRTGHFRWPVKRHKLKSHASGDVSEASWLGWPVHGFTHLDAARHFAPDGPTTDDLALDTVIGEAAVVDVSAAGRNGAIEEAMVAAAGAHVRAGDIVLMRAAWDTVASIDTPEFWSTAPFMTAEACRWLLARGIKAIGYDFPQDYCIRDLVTGDRVPAREENTTHVELLLQGVTMIEYLCNLGAIPGLRTEFFALPLNVPACDGAPVRAIAIESD